MVRLNVVALKLPVISGIGSGIACRQRPTDRVWYCTGVWYFWILFTLDLFIVL